MTHFNWRGISKRIFILDLYIENILLKKYSFEIVSSIKKCDYRTSSFGQTKLLHCCCHILLNIFLFFTLLPPSKLVISLENQSFFLKKIILKIKMFTEVSCITLCCSVHLKLFSQFKSDRFWYFVNNSFQAVFIYQPLNN